MTCRVYSYDAVSWHTLGDLISVVYDAMNERHGPAHAHYLTAYVIDHCMFNEAWA